jgi:hypothetical protein
MFITVYIDGKKHLVTLAEFIMLEAAELERLFNNAKHDAA